MNIYLKSEVFYSQAIILKINTIIKEEIINQTNWFHFFLMNLSLQERFIV